MIGEAGIPPDPGVNRFRQNEALVVRAGFARGAVQMHKIWVRDERVGSFVFAGVIVDAGGFFRTAGAAAFAVEDVHDIVVWLIHLRLREEGKQVLIAAVAVDDDDFLAAVARHLVGGFLKQPQLKLHAVGHGARLVLGLKNLAKIIFGKNDGVLLLRGVQRRVAHVQEIGAEREMWAVLFQNAEWEQTRALRLLNRQAEVRCRQLFPLRGELGLRVERKYSEKRNQ